MRMVVIYDHPSDYPDHFVGRLFLVNEQIRPTIFKWVDKDLEKLRNKIQTRTGVTNRIVRHEKDDPVILETWI